MISLYPKCYTDCSQLPLLNFIKVLTTDDKSWLMIKRGWVFRNNKELENIWDNIFMEYTELSQDKQGSHIFGLIKELTTVKNRLDQIQNSISALFKIYEAGIGLDKFQPLINNLKSLAGVSFKFSEETLLEDLKKTETVAKKYVVQYEETLAEYQKIAKSEQSKATEKDYYEQMAFISDNLNGVNIDPKTTTVLQYIGYINHIKQKAA